MNLSPCQSIMKKISALPSTESGKPCYIMIGQSIKYDPTFLEVASEKKERLELNLECQANVNAAMKTQSVSNLKQLIKDRVSIKT